ncbi:ROK family protein [Streptomyces sp. NPDC059455]|uniref:ROK family protein n=1 Tax=Streptomyces sp. NPDC059455 TaxID=3346837 RepID=UPI0036CB77E8
MYLYLGTGVGAGLFLNGDIHRGVSANAGEFGQLCAVALERVGADGRPEILPECNPPVSVPGTAARLGLALGPRAAHDPREAHRVVSAAAGAGDPVAEKAMRHVAGAIGRGALSLVDLLDIDLIVLGGAFFTDGGRRPLHGRDLPCRQRLPDRQTTAPRRCRTVRAQPRGRRRRRRVDHLPRHVHHAAGGPSRTHEAVNG